MPEVCLRFNVVLIFAVFKIFLHNGENPLDCSAASSAVVGSKNKVKKKVAGRPRRSESDVDLHALGSRLRQLRAQTTQEEFAGFLGIELR